MLHSQMSTIFGSDFVYLTHSLTMQSCAGQCLNLLILSRKCLEIWNDFDHSCKTRRIVPVHNQIQIAAKLESTIVQGTKHRVRGNY